MPPRGPDERTLRALFQGVVWAVAAASVGCESGATPTNARDASDVVDVSTTPDLGSCATGHEIIGTDADCPTEATYFPCSLPDDLSDATVGKVLDLEYCDRYCTITSTKGGTYCYLQPVDAGMVFQCQIQCIGGRRPEGYRESGEGTGLAGWFARLAALEGASVAAFERLAVELSCHGAPTDMVERAREAADDERRHRLMVGGLARRFGPRDESRGNDINIEQDQCKSAERTSTVSQLTSSLPWGSSRGRPLLEVARENAVEGCVREAYGALVATWQAAHAQDAAVARAMAAIAVDETRHAALSWALHDWALPRLDEADRATVAAAMADAWRSLHRELSPADGPFVTAAGLPTMAQQRALLALIQFAISS